MENLGVFRGKHAFDLHTSEEWNNKKPVLLFGGMNGSGKTTLFEGIKLCLYGCYVKGYRLADSEYQQYLRDRIHRHAGLLESEDSAVSISFEHVHLGKKSRYFVKRSWAASGKSPEKLSVLQDGRPIEGIPADQLQDFLMELIPLGLSKLFFFDGEQIQNLAEDDPSNRRLAEAFSTLLGLDILQHLDTDIGIHLSKKLQADETDVIVQLSKLQKVRDSLEADLTEKRRLKSQKENEIGIVLSEIDKQEREIASQGGGYASRRSQLKTRKEILSSEIASEENHIRELASALLPFAIVPTYCKRLKQRLIQEAERDREVLGSELLYKTITELATNVETEDFWKGIDVRLEQRKLISTRLIAALSSKVKQRDSSKLLLLHQLSASDQAKLLNWIDQALNWVPAELRNATVSCETKLRELRQLEESLSSVPPEETLAPYIHNLNSLHETLGSLRQEEKILDESVRHFVFELNENDRLQRKIAGDQKEAERDRGTTELASKVREVLREFSSTLRKRKLAQVSERFVEAFNSLATKKNLVDKIQIDEEDFSLKLYRKDGVVLPKDQLSAGEKQVYAIAMLTALARVSGRPLPFIIDTPLARLDSRHRTNLVENFFPKASHQVIIFSTNTEIDREYFEQLEPSVARAYLLSYDEQSESTTELNEYFWKVPSLVDQS